LSTFRVFLYRIGLISVNVTSFCKSLKQTTKLSNKPCRPTKVDKKFYQRIGVQIRIRGGAHKTQTPFLGGSVRIPISSSLTLGNFSLALLRASLVVPAAATTLLPTTAAVKPAYFFKNSLGICIFLAVMNS